MRRSRPFVFPSVNPAFFCGRGGFYALLVDNCVTVSFILSCVCPLPFYQRRTNLFLKPASDCGVIKVCHCCTWWKIVRQISPFISVICAIQHCIYQFSLFPVASVPCLGKQRFYDGPLTVALIARITASLILLYHAPIIAPLQLLNSLHQRT